MSDYIPLDKLESYFYWNQLVKKPWVLVTNGSTEKRPTEGYFFPDPDDLGLFPIITDFRPYNQKHPSPMTHALRITVAGDPENAHLKDDDKAKFDIVILPEGALNGWNDGIVWGSFGMWPFPMIWQNRLWEDCGLSVPPSFPMKKDLVAVDPSKLTELRSLPHAMATPKLRLFLAMMDRFWNAQDVDFKARALDAGNVGIAGTHGSTSVSIQSKKAGLRCPNWNVLKDPVAAIIRDAAAYFSGENEEERRFNAEQSDTRLVQFFVPDDLDAELGRHSSGSWIDHFASRSGYSEVVKYLAALVEKAEDPRVKAIVAERLAAERERRGEPREF